MQQNTLTEHSGQTRQTEQKKQTEQSEQAEQSEQRLQTLQSATAEPPQQVQKNQMALHILVSTLAQLEVACRYPCGRIYVEFSLYSQNVDQIGQYIAGHPEIEFYVALPHLLRQRDVKTLQAWSPMPPHGVLVRNLEGLAFAQSLRNQGSLSMDIVTDAMLPCWNTDARAFLAGYASECYLPYELNQKEERALLPALSAPLPQPQSTIPSQAQLQSQPMSMSLVVYGTLPMMVSAGCLRKTAGQCIAENANGTVFSDLEGGKQSAMNFTGLQDRTGRIFPVLSDCAFCYNVVYNSLPYSLHRYRHIWEQWPLAAIRLDFVRETAEETEAVLSYYMADFAEKSGRAHPSDFPIENYTAGHFKRGVE